MHIRDMVTDIAAGKNPLEKPPRVQLNDILGSFTPEMEEKFAVSFCGHVKGEVRLGIWLRCKPVLLMAIGLLWLWTMHAEMPAGAAMLLFVAIFMGGLVLTWQAWSWKLEFDGESGFIRFRSLFGGSDSFHITEVERIWTEDVGFGKRGRLLPQELLHIRTEERTIDVALCVFLTDGIPPKSKRFSADTGSEKLERYMDLYKRYFMGREELLAAAEADEQAFERREKVYQETWETLAEEPVPELAPAAKETAAPDIPELSEQEKAGEMAFPLKHQPYADEAEEKPAKVSLTKETPAPEAPAAEADGLSAEAPQPHESTVKEAPNVDELFDQVLRQYGKETRFDRKARRKGWFGK